MVFNLHRAAGAAGGGAAVVVVEGFFDCLKVHQAGYAQVVALLGASLSARQRELLLARFQELVLMLDGDATGGAPARRWRPGGRRGFRCGGRLCRRDGNRTSYRLLQLRFG